MLLWPTIIVAALAAVPAELNDRDDRAINVEELPSCCRVPDRWAVSKQVTSPELSIDQSEAGTRISIDGKLFAEYRASDTALPVVWPILGPTGHAMTRSYPLGPRLPGEADDHPHHRSFWFAHGDVNGHDFWHTPASPGTKSPQVVHREFLRREVNDNVAVVETANDWLADGEVVLTDERTLRFGTLEAAADAPRFVDFTIRLIASHGPVTFGDTKEGTFAVRVPGAMKVDADLGGQIKNDSGQSDGNAWGQPAKWVAYSGPLKPESDDVGGIVIMCNPASFRPRCRWHTREYGLFGANPFGSAEFPEGGEAQGAVTIDEGDSLQLGYRVIFYSGDATPEAIRLWYDGFAKSAGRSPQD